MTKETPRVLTPEELPPELKAAFAEIFTLESDIADLKAKHIEPKADARTAAWRSLKAKTDFARKDLDLFYKIYKRERIAREMDDEAEGERIIANMRRIYEALRAGETLDWLDVADASGGSAAPEAEQRESVAATGMFEDAPEGATSARKSNGKKVKAAPAEKENPEDWDGADGMIGSDEELDGGGYTFAAGQQAAEKGETREANPHPKTSASHGLWDRGWMKGAPAESGAALAH